MMWGDKLTESTVCIQFLSPDSFPVSLLFQSLQVSLSLGFLVTQSLCLSQSLLLSTNLPNLVCGSFNMHKGHAPV